MRSTYTRCRRCFLALCPSAARNNSVHHGKGGRGWPRARDSYDAADLITLGIGCTVDLQLGRRVRYPDADVAVQQSLDDTRVPDHYLIVLTSIRTISQRHRIVRVDLLTNVE